MATGTAIADERGLEAVTIAAVAAELGVRPPSLYNHVRSRAALHGAIGARALEELAAAMGAASAGLAGGDALAAIATAQRDLALRHPGAYAATRRVVGVDDERFEAAAARVLELLLAALRGYGLQNDDAIHAARAVRSAVHGFVSLELAGDFAMPQAVDASFAWMIRALAAGLAAA